MRQAEEWIVAYRKRDKDQFLIENQTTPFVCVGNTWRYWCADPHLLEYQGRTYIFAELYDRILRRGVIGCCEVTNTGCTQWEIVIKEQYHLSYPHVFEKNGEVFLIPESCFGNEIAMYKAISFPNEWQKINVLRKDCVAVDSTVFSCMDQQWVLTLESEGENELFRLYKYENEALSEPLCLVARNSDQIRPAGKLFMHKGRWIRPAQDCSEGYGCALNFYHVTMTEEVTYSEELVAKIMPDWIRSDFSGEPKGIHTYNVSDKYEVIDLKYYKVDLWLYVMRPVWFLWRRIKRMLEKVIHE